MDWKYRVTFRPNFKSSPFEAVLTVTEYEIRNYRISWS